MPIMPNRRQGAPSSYHTSSAAFVSNMATSGADTDNLDGVLASAESGTTIGNCSMDAALVAVRLLHATRQNQWFTGHLVVVMISNDTDNTLLQPAKYESQSYIGRMPTNVMPHESGFVVASSSITLLPTFSFKGLVSYKVSGLFVNEPFSILQVGWEVQAQNTITGVKLTAQCGVNVGQHPASKEVWDSLVGQRGYSTSQTPVSLESGRLSLGTAMVDVSKKNFQYLLTVKLSERPCEDQTQC